MNGHAARVREQEVDNQTATGSYPVRVFCTAAHITVDLDHVEVARRREAALGAVIGRDLLEALMGLPVGLPVPITALTERERVALQQAPQAVVERVGDDLTRHAVAPLTPRLAVVPAQTWRRGLELAGRFASVCMRTTLLPQVPKDLDEAQMRASFYGVGLAVRENGFLRTLVEPEPYVHRRHSSAKWWFAEEIYRQITKERVQ